MAHGAAVALLLILLYQILCLPVAGDRPEGCGGNFTSRTGVFTTPNHPNAYPPYSECFWVITVKSPNVIRVDFSIFRLENPSIITGNCDYDVLHVIDGNSPTGSILNSYCGSANPSPIISKGPVLGFLFQSDESVALPGFRASYMTVPPPTPTPETTPKVHCGTEVISDNDWITSPKYPTKYGHLSDCVYIISLRTNGIISLQFHAFDIENAASCQHDYLEVRDGESEDSPLLGRYCGAVAPRITGSGQVLHLRFISDETVNKAGFNASWSKAYCKDYGGVCQQQCLRGQTTYPCGNGRTCCQPQVLPTGCGVSNQQVPSVAPLVVGGQEAAAAAWPWQVSLQDGGYHYCGATLIAEQWVLTAAHCVLALSSVDMVLGAHDLNEQYRPELRTQASKVIIHEGYKPGTPYPDDIALLKLSRPVKFTKYYRPLCLPTPVENFTALDECYLTGWGQSDSDSGEKVLRQVRVEAWREEACAGTWGSQVVRETNICFGNGTHGACKNDLGGPVSCLRSGRWVLAAISSWGKVDCQEQGFPTICTKVSKYISWILEKMLLN